MLLWLLMIGGVGAVLLAFMAVRGPSASKNLKRRVELIKERHGDVIAGNAQAQIRKLFADRANKIESYASTLIPKPALLRKRLEQTGKDISLGKYAMVCIGVISLVMVGLMVRGEPAFPPATPYGIVELLLRSGVELEGAEVVVVGYGELVGAPLSIMLAQDSIRGNATVTCCHVKTRDLAAHTRRADILVAAAGVPEMIGGDMIKPGATVIDVGVHRTSDGLVGDVRFAEACEVAGAITPVPGGVGPMTTSMLLVNTVAAAEAQAFST